MLLQIYLVKGAGQFVSRLPILSIIFLLQALMQNILTKLQESMKWVHGPWAQNFFVIEMEERILGG